MAKAKDVHLFVDQYGQKFFARTLKELGDKVGRSKIEKMYRDDKAGKSWHVGYVAGDLWLTEYAPVRREA